MKNAKIFNLSLFKRNKKNINFQDLFAYPWIPGISLIFPTWAWMNDSLFDMSKFMTCQKWFFDVHKAFDTLQPALVSNNTTQEQF